MKVNGKDYPIYYGNIMENKKCLKPPTSFKMFTYFSRYFGASRDNIYIYTCIYGPLFGGPPSTPTRW
jgi:hypothetical protein